MALLADDVAELALSVADDAAAATDPLMLDALLDAFVELVDAEIADRAALASLAAALVAAVSAAVLELVMESTSVGLVPVPL